MICIKCKRDLLQIDFRPQDDGVCITCSGYRLKPSSNIGVFEMRTHAKSKCSGRRGGSKSRFGKDVLGIN